ncbi:MAG: class I SAM-dependent methyltransferase [Geodermatophilaceae bacterium]|nr:class I SAM-dependent methyltransferase [Geodermatophilaceae bacterium]
MRWNAPLSERRAEELLDRLDLRPGQSLLDVGCGWGELLLRAARACGGGCVATGVDTDRWALRRGADAALERGLDVRFVPAEARDWAEPADRVLCVGASHAWGGTRHALTALAALVHPDGRLLFGDACWERTPSPAAAEMFGAEVLPLADVVRAAMGAGWRILDVSTSDQQEWDSFESAYRLARQVWLLAHPDSRHAPRIRDQVDSQLTTYVSTYRAQLGFCYLVMAR